MNKYILESSVYQLFKTINHDLDAATQIDISDDISMIAFGKLMNPAQLFVFKSKTIQVKVKKENESEREKRTEVEIQN